MQSSSCVSVAVCGTIQVAIVIANRLTGDMAIWFISRSAAVTQHHDLNRIAMNKPETIQPQAAQNKHVLPTAAIITLICLSPIVVIVVVVTLSLSLIGSFPPRPALKDTLGRDPLQSHTALLHGWH